MYIKMIILYKYIKIDKRYLLYTNPNIDMNVRTYLP